MMKRNPLGPKRAKRWFEWLIFILGVLVLTFVLLLLRLTIVTDYFYHSLVKDPPRQIPPGNNIVSPADGMVLYIKQIKDGIIPEVVKKDVKIVQDPSRLRPVDVEILQGDCSKFKKETGWEAEISFEKTMGDLLNYWRDWHNPAAGLF